MTQREHTFLTPMGWPVELTEEDMDAGIEIGTEWHDRARKRGQKHLAAYVPSIDDGLANSILGAQGEIAFCTSMMRPWSAEHMIDAYKKRRDQLFCEVRTRREGWRELFIRDHEPGNCPCVLVNQLSGRQFVVRGWLWGFELREDGRRENFGANQGRELTVSAVSHNLLREMRTLPAVVGVLELQDRGRKHHRQWMKDHPRQDPKGR